MPNLLRTLLVTIPAFVVFGAARPVIAQGYDPSLFQEMRWRMIGPFRASRTKAGTGVPSQPNVFYIGVVNASARSAACISSVSAATSDGDSSSNARMSGAMSAAIGRSSFRWGGVIGVR